MKKLLLWAGLLLGLSAFSLAQTTVPTNPNDANHQNTTAPTTPPTFPTDRQAPPPAGDQAGSAGSIGSQSDQNSAPGETQQQDSVDNPHAGAGSTDYQTLIQKAMQDRPALSNVTVSVPDDSTVELAGHVHTQKDKEIAGKVAESYAHGRRVVNDITVDAGQN